MFNLILNLISGVFCTLIVCFVLLFLIALVTPIEFELGKKDSVFHFKVTSKHDKEEDNE
ncbi:hypothetical protein G8V07_12510 [Clostridium botulinum D/C]|uniref:hypothetical protein n=1 Tax=Clostridium botulinum TaxID=1491 RepID=UPI001E292DF8|nr:hypothetical protein [Clostridium botulinum]MCD3321131.1 hypothetical protein [Clostridium botulinum D/C]MCD3324571.1 hypothetical protein [Clostridium botulinum D/C]MCD3326863.1 hypothetical protein [Clostridium botulinum D/C]